MAPGTNGTALAERDEKTGRFLVGNSGGPGNPRPKTAIEWRYAFRAAVTATDIRLVTEALVRQAKAGNLPAIHELLERCFGKNPIFAAEELGSSPVMVSIDLAGVLDREIGRAHV